MASKSMLKAASQPHPLRVVLLSCRKVDLKPHELLQHVFIPFTEPNEYVREFKQVDERTLGVLVLTR